MAHLKMLTVAGGVKVHATSTNTSLLIRITTFGLALKKVKFDNLRLLVTFCDNILVSSDVKNILPENLKLRHSSFLDPVDCALSQWGEWSRCMNTNGIEEKTRNRVITIEASNGGINCSGPTEETIPCNEEPGS